MSDQPPPIVRHQAVDRFGTTALRTAHRLTAAMAESGGGEEPILLRTDGPHRSLDSLAALIDEALADEDAGGTQTDGQPRDTDPNNTAEPS